MKIKDFCSHYSFYGVDIVDVVYGKKDEILIFYISILGTESEDYIENSETGYSYLYKILFKGVESVKPQPKIIYDAEEIHYMFAEPNEIDGGCSFKFTGMGIGMGCTYSIKAKSVEVIELGKKILTGEQS